MTRSITDLYLDSGSRDRQVDRTLNLPPLGQLRDTGVGNHLAADQMGGLEGSVREKGFEQRIQGLLGFLNADNLNRWPVEGLAQEAPNIRSQLSTTSGEVMRQLCLAGEGIACLSRFMIQEDLVQGRLVTLMADRMISPNPRESVQAVYYRNTALSGRIGAFLDFIAPRLRL